jgi:5-methyltetrahydropteroyltriglutamate--homocysteine methyltransferase
VTTDVSIERSPRWVISRAESVGSLLRPEYLVEARRALEADAISNATFKRIEDRAVREAVALQWRCGLDVVSDGELRRRVFTSSLVEAVEGIDGPPPPATSWRGSDGNRTTTETETVARASVSGKLRRVRSLVSEEYTFLRSLTERPTKVTLPSPLMLGKSWNPATSSEAYPDPFDAFADAVDVLKEEIRELARLGCEYVQIDAPEIATLADPAVREQYDRLGIGADRMLTEGVALIDAVTEGSVGVRFALHLCRGNNRSRWLAEGGYDRIAEHVFPRVGGYEILLLEYDDERSGDFEPLAATLDHQIVVLGLVSSKVPELEPEDTIITRIEEAASIVPLERLALSCQCGFASTMAGNEVGSDVQQAKLELVARVARSVWG